MGGTYSCKSDACGSKQVVDLAPGEGREFVERLYEEYNQDLCRFLSRLNIEEGRVDSIAHDVYLRILRMNEPEKLRASPKSYLLKVAVNIVRDQARRESRHRRYELGQRLAGVDVSIAPTPEMEVIGQQTAAIIRQAMLDLPEQHRKILLQHRFHNMSCREIAEEMDMAQRTVERYLSYAVAFCQSRLRKLEDE